MVGGADARPAPALTSVAADNDSYPLGDGRASGLHPSRGLVHVHRSPIVGRAEGGTNRRRRRGRSLRAGAGRELRGQRTRVCIPGTRRVERARRMGCNRDTPTLGASY